MNRRAWTLAVAVMTSAGCSCPGSNTIPYEEFCPTLNTGALNAWLAGSACGLPVSRADVARRAILPSATPSLLTLGMTFMPFDCANDRFAGSLSAGRMKYDGAAAYECRALGRSLQMYDGGRASSAIDAGECYAVFTGMVAEGSACEINEDCAEGTYCAPATEGGCGGVCRAMLGAGTPCSPGRQLCNNGGSCASAGDGGYACQDPRPATPVGASCPSPGSSSICTDSLYCVGVPDAGECRARATTGELCGTGSDGQPPCANTCDHCVADGGPALCTPRGLIDAPCLANSDCANFMYCNAAGQCVVQPREGESCVIAASAGNGTTGNCMYGDNFCKRDAPGSTTGVCSLMPRLDEACGDNFDLAKVCYGGWCKPNGAFGVCAASQGLDELCGSSTTPSSTCQSGLLCILDAGTRTCRPRPIAGERCTGTCDPQSSCEPDAGGSFCEPKQAAGASCNGGDRCSSGYCDPVTNTCAARCVEVDGGCSLLVGRQIALYLMFAMVLVPSLRRPRRRAA